MIHYIDILESRIPKYIPFQCRINSKYDNNPPFTSELLIKINEDQPISLRTKEPYIISLNSTQVLKLIPYDYEEISRPNVENITDKMENFGPINLLTDGVMVFFTCKYSRNPYEDYIMQVLKKLGDNWYYYDQDSELWTSINIKTNILSFDLSSIIHKYICIEDLS